MFASQGRVGKRGFASCRCKEEIEEEDEQYLIFPKQVDAHVECMNEEWERTSHGNNLHDFCDITIVVYSSSLKHVWMFEETSKDSLVKDEFDACCDDKYALFGEKNEFFEENKYEFTSIGNVIYDVNNCC